MSNLYDQDTEPLFADSAKKLAERLSGEAIDPPPMEREPAELPEREERVQTKKFMSRVERETADYFEQRILGNKPGGEKDIPELYNAYAKLKGISYEDTEKYFDEINGSRFKEEATPVIQDIKKSWPTLLEWAARPENTEFVNSTKKLKNLGVFGRAMLRFNQGMRTQEIQDDLEDIEEISARLGKGAGTESDRLFLRAKAREVRQNVMEYNHVWSALEKNMAMPKEKKIDKDKFSPEARREMVNRGDYAAALKNAWEEEKISASNTWDFIKEFVTSEAVVGTVAEGLPTSWPGLVTTAAFRAHPLVGAAVTPFTMYQSYKINRNATFMNQLRKKGVDLTNPDAIEKAFMDEDLMKGIAKDSRTSGAVTSATELLLSAATGSMLRKIPGGAKMAPVRLGGAFIGEAIEESVGGAAGQLAIGEEITATEMAVEGITGGLTGTIAGGAFESLAPLSKRIMDGVKRKPKTEAKPKPKPTPETKPKPTEETRPEDVIETTDETEVEIGPDVDIPIEEETAIEKPVELPIEEFEQQEQPPEVPETKESTVEEIPVIEEILKQQEGAAETVDNFERLFKVMASAKHLLAKGKLAESGSIAFRPSAYKNLLNSMRNLDEKVQSFYVGKRRISLEELVAMKPEEIATNVSLLPDPSKQQTFEKSVETLRVLTQEIEKVIESFGQSYGKDVEEAFSKYQGKFDESFKNDPVMQKFTRDFLGLVRETNRWGERITGVPGGMVKPKSIDRSSVHFPGALDNNETRRNNRIEELEKIFGKDVVDTVRANYPGMTRFPSPISFDKEEVKGLSQDEKVRYLNKYAQQGHAYVNVLGYFSLGKGHDYGTFFHEYAHYLLRTMTEAYVHLNQMPTLNEEQDGFRRMYEDLMLFLGTDEELLNKLGEIPPSLLIDSKGAYDWRFVTDFERSLTRISTVALMRLPSKNKRNAYQKFVQRMVSHGHKKTPGYYRRVTEVFARLMEEYVAYPDRGHSGVIATILAELPFRPVASGVATGYFRTAPEKGAGVLLPEGVKLFDRLFEAMSLVNMTKDLESVAKEVGKEEAPIETPILGKEQRDEVVNKNREVWKNFADTIEDAPKNIELLIETISGQMGVSLREVLLGDGGDIYLYFNYGDYSREDSDSGPMYDVLVRHGDGKKQEFDYKTDTSIKINPSKLDENLESVISEVSESINKERDKAVSENKALDTADRNVIEDETKESPYEFSRPMGNKKRRPGEGDKENEERERNQKVLQKSSRVKAATVTEILRRLAKADEQREDPKYREKYQENIEWAKEELGKKFPVVGKIFELAKTGRLDKEQIKTALGRSRLGLPTLVTEGEAEIHQLDEAALASGYESAQDFAKDIAKLPRDLDDLFAQLVRMKTDGEMGVENYTLKELILIDGLGTEYESERDSQLRTELSWLHEKHKNLYKETLGRTVARLPSWQSLKASAAKAASQMDIKEFAPLKLSRLERQWAKAAAAALKKGDVDAAFEAKIQEAKYYEMWKVAIRFHKYKDKSIQKVKKRYSKDAKGRDKDVLSALQGLLTVTGFIRSPNRQVVAHLEGLRKYNPLGYEKVRDMTGKALKQLGSGNLTVDKFVNIMDTADSLWELAGLADNLMVEGRKRAKEEVVEEARGHLENVRVSKVRPEGLIKGMIFTFDGWMTMASGFFSRLDETGKTGGFWKRVFLDPMRKAEENYTEKYGQTAKEVKEKFGEYEKTQDKETFHRPIEATEIEHTFKSKSELIGALLHTGNMGNLTRLLHGYGWATIDEDGKMDASNWNAFIQRMIDEGVLTKAEFDLVQSIWDINASILPDAQKAHFEIFGTYYEEIKHRKFSTPFGEYSGGYYPAVASKDEMVEREMRSDERAILNGETVSSQVFPGGSTGFTKLRASSPKRKLGLDPNYALAHIGMVLRYTYLQPTVVQSAKLFTSKGMRTALEAVHEGAWKDVLEPWLSDTVQQKRAKSLGSKYEALDNTLVQLRRLSAARIMFANVRNSLLQITGLSLAVPSVGLGQMIKHIPASVVGNSRKSINEKSAFMRLRSGNMVFDARREIDRLLTQKGNFETAWDWVLDNSYFMQNITQSYVDRVVWSAGYDRAISRGMSDTDAVSFADDAVRKTQGSYEIGELSVGERGNHFVRLFTMFSRFNIMRYNLMKSRYHEITEGENFNLLKHGPAMFNAATWTLFLPEITYSALAAYMFAPADDDEDEKLRNFAVESGINVATGWMPILGPIVSSPVERWTGSGWGGGAKLSPITGLLDDVTRAGQQWKRGFSEDGDSYDLMVATLKTAGLVVPLKPVENVVKGVQKINEGEVEPGDELGVIITGR